MPALGALRRTLSDSILPAIVERRAECGEALRHASLRDDVKLLDEAAGACFAGALRNEDFDTHASSSTVTRPRAAQGRRTLSSSINAATSTGGSACATVPRSA